MRPDDPAARDPLAGPEPWRGDVHREGPEPWAGTAAFAHGHPPDLTADPTCSAAFLTEPANAWTRTMQGDPMDDRDELIERVRSVLAPMPPADPAAVARVLAAVAADAESRPADVLVTSHGTTASRAPTWLQRQLDTWRAAARHWWQRPAFVGGLGALATAALVVAVTMRTAPVEGDVAPVNGEAFTTALGGSAGNGDAPIDPALGDSIAPLVLGDGDPMLVSASEAESAAMPVPVQFLFAGRARTVALVGDFNGWDADSMPLTRVPGTDNWITSVPIVPGRHVYAFVVDGTRWEIDPDAPVAPDDDFGKPGSVILVKPR